jgi:tRNA dimethylallyltransferase
MCAKTVIIIAGPTAAGKTVLSLEIARYFQTTIISADSRQCFRELNIGVAKPSVAELLSVKQEFINSHSIHEEVNAALFEQLALQWAGEIFSRKDVLVMVGGTGLYLKAFCEGLDAVPPADEQRRIDIRQQYNLNGLPWLQEQIRLRDPVFFEKGEIHNPYRMMRALEVIESTGNSILSFHQSAKKDRPFRICFFGLQVPKETLYRRINERVDMMMDAGLLEEVRSLVPFRHLNALQTVGYTELFEYLDGEWDLPDSISLIKQHTRHYAKRQMTWFRKNQSIQWLENNSLQEVLELYGKL